MKRWQYISVQNDEVFFAFAFINLSYFSLVFYYLWDKKNRKMLVEKRRKYPGGCFVLLNHPTDEGGESLWKWGKDYAHTFLQDDQLFFSFHLGDLKGSLRMDRVMPTFHLKTNLDKSGAHWGETFKDSWMKTHGEIIFQKRKFQFLNHQGTSDWSGGRYLRKTKWSWASLVGDNFGINLARDLYTGEKGESLESYIDIANQRIFFTDVTFDFAPEIKKITAFNPITQNKMELSFWATSIYNENTYLVFIRSHLQQMLGEYSVTFDFPSQQIQLNLQNQFGVLERHHTTW